MSISVPLARTQSVTALMYGASIKFGLAVSFGVLPHERVGHALRQRQGLGEKKQKSELS